MEAGLFQVRETRKQSSGVFMHLGINQRGELHVGDPVRARVDGARRQSTALNHSATHLMHAALRNVLGEHVQQKGSLVSVDRLRFDFSHYEPLSHQQLQEIERLVNREIRANHTVETRIMSLEDAKRSGAMALFGEKYANQVRVLRIGDFSVELCGGTHVRAAGDIGLFKIVSEQGVASGVRRIEAVTGEQAYDWLASDEERMIRIADLLKSGRDDLEHKVAQLVERNRRLERELDQLKGKLASSQGSDLVSQALQLDGFKLLVAHLEGADPKGLRELLDQLKNKLGSAVILLATVSGGKVSLAAGVTQDLTQRFSAGNLVRHVAEQVGGKGGGRADMAQAGGSDPAGLPAALASVEPWIGQQT